MIISNKNEYIGDSIESPCIGVCRLDDRGICIGCKRTAKQIKNWWDYSDDEKIKINRDLKPNSDITQNYYGDI